MLALRLYAPEVSAKPPSEIYLQATLREAFYLHVEPALVGKSPATLNEYLKALDHWEAFTTNPPIGEIDDLVCERFRKDAFDDDEFSPATVNKWMRHLTAILNRLGPKSPRNKKGKSILTEIPFFESLPEQEPDPVCLTVQEINAFYNHCRVADWPNPRRSGCQASDFWRAAVVMLITYGPRRSDLFRIKWKQVDFDRETIGFRAKKTGKWHQFPMTPVVKAHLQEIHSDREFVLPVTSSNHYLYRTFQEIQHAAKIKRGDGEPYGFQNFRQTCAARADEHIPGTAAVILGHAISSVTRDNYLGQQALLAACRCIKTIAQPSAFEAILSRQSAEYQQPEQFSGSD